MSPSDAAWQQLISKLHASGRKAALAITGGGSGAIGELLRVPGGSRLLVEAQVPYDAQALAAFGRAISLAPNDDKIRYAMGLAHLRAGQIPQAAQQFQAALQIKPNAVEYMNERKIGDRTLAELQGLQWKIADMATQLEGARLLLQRAVHMAGSTGTPPALETAMAKTAANLAAKFVCDEAIQLLGGYGFSREYPVERVYRDIRGLCIGAGTVEIQRNFVGTSVLRGATPASDGWKSRRA